MLDDGLDDHPDLKNLRLSKDDERAARAAVRQARRVRPTGPSFLRRHRPKVVAIVALGVVVAVGALLVNGSRRGETSQPSGAAPRTAYGVDVDRPFAGTPAEGWADGEAGIVAPEPAAVGDYPAEAVAAAYTKVRLVLITARLDRSVIEDHDEEKLLALLAPEAQAEPRRDFAAHPDKAYAYATRVADGFHLLPAQPKVRGSMRAEQADDGALRVRTNYAFAYAFAPAGEVAGPLDIVAVDRFEADFAITDDRWPTPSRGVWVEEVEWYGYSIACAAYRRGELAPSYSDRTTTPEAMDDSEKARFFDPTQPMPTTSSCPT